MSPPLTCTTHQQQGLVETTLEDLRLMDIIGSGSSGTVRKAMHRASGTVLVLKSIPFNTADESIRKQIRGELRTMYGAQHPNLVQFYQSFFSDGAISILMEVRAVVWCLPVARVFLQYQHIQKHHHIHRHTITYTPSHAHIHTP